MYKESDQMTEFNKSALDTALQLAQIALDSTEQLVGLQWDSTKQSLADAHSVLQPESNLWDLQTLLGLRAKLAEKNAENAAGYLRNVFKVAAYTKNQIAELFTVQWREWGKHMNTSLPLVIQGSTSLVSIQPALDPVAAPTQSGDREPVAAAVAPAEIAVSMAAVVPAEEPSAVPVAVSEETAAFQTIDEPAVLPEVVETAVQEPEPAVQRLEAGELAKPAARARRTAITASDFTGTRSPRPAVAAPRSGKSAKPVAEPSKPAAAKKKQTAKR